MDEPTNETPEPQTLGLLAELAGPDELVEAAGKTTDSGYRHVEAFAPFPIHGIDDALKAKKTILPWLVFCCGMTGCLVALAMQYYMNASEETSLPFSGYQYAISGKPYFSLPANIPVTFELIILFSSFGSFFGMWILNGLPRLSNPLFKSERFSTATSHGFFLWIDAKDPKFSESESTAYLESIGATNIEPVQDDVEGTDVPGVLLLIGVISAAIALVPPLWIAAAAGESSQPRLSIWWGMDYQPKYKAQAAVIDPNEASFMGLNQKSGDKLFNDGRSMRVAVEGTVARGMLQDDMQYYRGRNSNKLLTTTDNDFTNRSDTQFVRMLAEDAAAPAANTPDYATAFPKQVELSEETMDRGQRQYNIYCSTCHGRDGSGQGLIALRAVALEQADWVPPTNIHSPTVVSQPVGQIYESISIGVRNMPGYGHQISVADRWAIVMYLKALQRQRAELPAAEAPENKTAEEAAAEAS